jgi:hypothetical protein
MEAGLHSLLTYSLNGGKWTALHLDLFTAGEESPVPFAYGCGCAPDPVWTFWRRQKFCPAEIQTLE